VGDAEAIDEERKLLAGVAELQRASHQRTAAARAAELV
jgi:hypothetical protein